MKYLQLSLALLCLALVNLCHSEVESASLDLPVTDFDAGEVVFGEDNDFKPQEVEEFIPDKLDEEKNLDAVTPEPQKLDGDQNFDVFSPQTQKLDEDHNLNAVTPQAQRVDEDFPTVLFNDETANGVFKPKEKEGKRALKGEGKKRGRGPWKGKESGKKNGRKRGNRRGKGKRRRMGGRKEKKRRGGKEKRRGRGEWRGRGNRNRRRNRNGKGKNLEKAEEFKQDDMPDANPGVVMFTDE